MTWNTIPSSQTKPAFSKRFPSCCVQHLSAEKSPITLFLKSYYWQFGRGRFHTRTLLTSHSFSDLIHPSHWGPEGGRSGTADNVPAEKKLPICITNHSTASAPQVFPHCSPNDDGLFTSDTCVLFHRWTTWCHLCVGTRLLTLSFNCSFHSTFIWKVLCPCSVPFCKRDIKQGRRGMMAWTWWRWLFFVLSHCHKPQLPSFFWRESLI